MHPEAQASFDSTAESSWLRRLGVALVAAKVVVLPLAFDPFSAVAFDLPKASASRAILYSLLATMLAYVVAHRGRSLGWSRIYAAVVALVAVYSAATLTAVHVPTALFGAPGSYLGLVTLLDNVVLAAAVGMFVRSQGDFFLVGAAAVGTAAVTLVYEGVQLTGRDPIPWDNAGAISSTVGNAGPFSVYLLTIAAAVAAYLVTADDPSWRYRPADRLRVGLAAFCAACVTLILLRGSRISELTLVPIVGVLILLAYRRHAARISPDRRRIVVVGVLLAAIALTIATAATPVGGRIARLASGEDTGSAERSVIYRAGAQMLSAHPLLGVGPDNFVAIYPMVRGPEPSTVAVLAETSAHSWFLKAAIDAGLLGLAVLLVLVGWLLIVGWRASLRREGQIKLVSTVMATAFLLQSIVSVSNIATEWLFWIAVGFIATPPVRESVADRAPVKTHRKGGRGRSRRGFGNVDRTYALVALGAGLLLSTTVVNAITASRLSKLSLHEVDLNDGGIAIAAALEATRRDSGRGEPWNALGVSYDAVGQIERSISAFRRAVAAEPYTRVYLTNLAEEEFKLVGGGHPELAGSALRDARAALAFAPTDPYTHYSYARMLNTLGGHEAEAMAEADRATQLAPGNGTYLVLAVTTHERVGDLFGAIERQRQIVDLDPVVAARVRLAHLYVASGDTRSARALIAPPRLSHVDRECAPPKPLCFRVLFVSDDPLQLDPARPDSVRSPGNFAVDGQALPPSATVTYDASVPGQPVVAIQLPVGGVRPPADATLTVRRVANSLGFALEPDPSTAAFP